MFSPVRNGMFTTNAQIQKIDDTGSSQPLGPSRCNLRAKCKNSRNLNIISGKTHLRTQTIVPSCLSSYSRGTTENSIEFDKSTKTNDN